MLICMKAAYYAEQFGPVLTRDTGFDIKQRWWGAAIRY
jgi:hypothetical protein